MDFPEKWDGKILCDACKHGHHDYCTGTIPGECLFCTCDMIPGLHPWQKAVSNG